MIEIQRVTPARLDDVLDGDDVLPGFALAVKEIFPGVVREDG